MNPPVSSSIEDQDIEVLRYTSVPRKRKFSSRFLRSTPTFSDYRDYLESKVDAQDDNLKTLKKFCRRHGVIPSVEKIDWITKEAKIIDKDHRLNLPIYFFMQYFKFRMFVSYETGQARLLVGHLPRETGRDEEVWFGWPEAKTGRRKPITAAKRKLYHMYQASERVAPIEFNPEVRKYIVWTEPLEKLLGMSRILVDRNLKTATQVQNAICLSVVKVVLRFPSLMEAVHRKEHPYRRSDFRRFSIGGRGDMRNLPRPLLSKHPYQVALDVLNAVPSPANAMHRCHPPGSEK